MKAWMFAGAAALVLVACGSHNEAKESIKKMLNDPESAQFSSLQDGKKKGDVCGFVNAKNRMGGYVGNTPFWYEKSTGMAAIVKAPEDSDFRSLWLGIRLNNYAEDLSKVLMQCRAVDQWGAVCASPLPQAQHQMCSVIQGDPSRIYSALQAAYDR